jgi:hypothetical protein
MRPAEFRCAREFLGLPVYWVATQLGVHAQTVYAWERRGAKIPSSYASDFLTKELAIAAQTVGTLTLEWTKQKGDTPLPVPAADPIEGRYPAAYYRQIASRVAERLTHVGIDYM